MKDSKQLVFVTGATGTVGDEVARRLLEEGYRVRALVRRDVPELAKAGAHPVRGDLTDREAVAVALEGADLVVHSAAYIGSDWKTARAVNVEGTRNVARAAFDAGVKRLIHISTGSVYNRGERSVTDEETPLWEPEESQSAYAQTKADAERVLRGYAGKGLAVSYLRLGMVMSAHPTSVWGPKLIERVREGMAWHPDDRLPCVHVRNIPDAVLLVMEAPEAVGEAYNLVDEHVKANQFYGRVAEWLGHTATVPDRAPNARNVRTEKIRDLGYVPRLPIADAIDELEQVARANNWL